MIDTVFVQQVAPLIVAQGPPVPMLQEPGVLAGLLAVAGVVFSQIILVCISYCNSKRTDAHHRQLLAAQDKRHREQLSEQSKNIAHQVSLEVKSGTRVEFAKTICSELADIIALSNYFRVSLNSRRSARRAEIEIEAYITMTATCYRVLIMLDKSVSEEEALYIALSELVLDQHRQPDDRSAELVSDVIDAAKAVYARHWQIAQSGE